MIDFVRNRMRFKKIEPFVVGVLENRSISEDNLLNRRLYLLFFAANVNAKGQARKDHRFSGIRNAAHNANIV